MRLIPLGKDGLIYTNHTNQSMHYYTSTKRKMKKHILILIDAKKCFKNISHPLMIKEIPKI